MRVKILKCSEICVIIYVKKKGAEAMHDLTYLNHFSFHEVKYDNYHESAFPFPARYNFIMYLKRGTAHIASDDETVVLNEGDALHIPRGAKYAVKLFGSPEIHFGSYAYLNHQENDGKRYGIQKIPMSNRMRELIDNVGRINELNCECIGCFYLFLHDLYKVLTPAVNDGKRTLLERAMDFIVRRPDCKISEVAEHCHISESGLYALFSERADFTPAHFKLHVKLERAVNYLISTDIPIEEISDLCGFSSSSYFRKKLFSVYKKTPTEIRRGTNDKTLGF